MFGYGSAQNAAALVVTTLFISLLWSGETMANNDTALAQVTSAAPAGW